jgi:alanine racemase
MQDVISRQTGASSFDAALARLTIDLSAVVDNWRLLSKLSGKARTSAVVKADAYGVGAGPVASALYRAGCRDFFVATPDEGAELRREVGNARIFVLTGLWSGAEEVIFHSNLIPVINSPEQLQLLKASGGNHAYALHVDTGMSRLGLTLAEAAELAATPGPKPQLVMSHLACPDHPAHAMNRQQLESFQRVAGLFEGVESSLSSSGGILLGADYHFDLTRPGIALYGGLDIDGVRYPTLQALTAEARVLQVRNVRKGEAASYGATHTFSRDGRVAVAAAGYADGWHRAMSGSGVAARHDGSAGAMGYVAGHLVPVVGRVTMDLTTFDISDLPEGAVVAGDYVELFGDHIAITDAACSAGTISFELLTSLGKRYVRQYV